MRSVLLGIAGGALWLVVLFLYGQCRQLVRTVNQHAGAIARARLERENLQKRLDALALPDDLSTSVHHVGDGLVSIANAIRFMAGHRDTPAAASIARVPTAEEEEARIVRERVVAKIAADLRRDYTAAGFANRFSDDEILKQAEDYYDGRAVELEESNIWR